MRDEIKKLKDENARLRKLLKQNNIEEEKEPPANKRETKRQAAAKNT